MIRHSGDTGCIHEAVIPWRFTANWQINVALFLPGCVAKIFTRIDLRSCIPSILHIVWQAEWFQLTPVIPGDIRCCNDWLAIPSQWIEIESVDACRAGKESRIVAAVSVCLEVLKLDLIVPWVTASIPSVSASCNAQISATVFPFQARSPHYGTQFHKYISRRSTRSPTRLIWQTEPIIDFRSLEPWSWTRCYQEDRPRCPRRMFCVLMYQHGWSRL